MAKSAISTTSNVLAPKVGLALGSGSARGLVHIGVLRAIEDAGIAIDFIAGTSMGALVGAVYAAGKLNEFEATFQSFDWKKTVSFFDVVLPKSGLLDGGKVSDLVREHVQSIRIEELPKPFTVVATDIASGEEVTITCGDVIDAVRASISVPGVFTPMRVNDRILVDGGFVNCSPALRRNPRCEPHVASGSRCHGRLRGAHDPPAFSTRPVPPGNAGSADHRDGHREQPSTRTG